MAEIEGECVGTVRLDQVEEGAVISYTIAHQWRGKGIGKLMLETALALAPKPVRAVIKLSNMASIRIAEAAGMKKISEENDMGVWIRTHDS
jgi:L-amino acid N-acyltransferase YncA